MVAKLLLMWVLLALAIGITAALVPGIDVDDGFGTLLTLALVLSLINVTIGTVLRVFTLPLQLLTLGLFGIVIDTAVLALTAWSSDSMSIDGFAPALVSAVLITIISAAMQLIAIPSTD